MLFHEFTKSSKTFSAGRINRMSSVGNTGLYRSKTPLIPKPVCPALNGLTLHVGSPAPHPSPPSPPRNLQVINIL